MINYRYTRWALLIFLYFQQTNVSACPRIEMTSHLYGDERDSSELPRLLFLGNSIMKPVYDLFISESQPFICTNIAVRGHTIEQQLDAWNALPGLQKHNFDFVLVQAGINNLDDSAYVENYQALINQINLDISLSCKIIAATMTPARDVVDFNNWQILNSSIRGEGSSPITGIDTVMTTNTTGLDLDGDGYLDPAFDSGDHLHPNNDGERVIMNNYLEILNALMKSDPQPPDSYVMRFSPNPFLTTGTIRIESTHDNYLHEHIVLQVINKSGKVVYRENISNPGNVFIRTLNLAVFSPGIYILQIISGSRQQSLKIIKQ